MSHAQHGRRHPMRPVQAIVPNRPARSRPYAWGSISVNPDPPRVGETTTIGFPLKNLDADEVVVERIEVKVALFGMGLAWEELGTIGPFHLPPDSPVTEAAIHWSPTVGGHRCVRATLYVQGLDQPLVVGRNLHVFEARADQGIWTLPFRLGNPERVAAPILLHLDGNDMPAIGGIVRIGGREALLDRPVWLEPRQVVEATLELRAQTEARLN